MEDHYTVLDLSQRRADATLTTDDLRKAYRRALLLHHPDKSEDAGRCHASKEQSRSAEGNHFTIDQITEAYNTLKDPSKRSGYDRDLTRLRQRLGQGDTRFFSGLDTVDLDDLHFDDASQTWRRACRCGHNEGFLVTEEDLDDVASQGELIIGCRGCSLWLKVLFQLAPHDEQDAEGS